jgi:hypothetical protein
MICEKSQDKLSWQTLRLPVLLHLAVKYGLSTSGTSGKRFLLHEY